MQYNPSSFFEDVLAGQISGVEGGYVNDPKDPGGETNHGVTIAVARENGYAGRMADMTKAQALAILKSKYYLRAGLHLLLPHSRPIVESMFDTGVNMGVGTAGKFLQRWLNLLNNQGRDYMDITVDGMVGKGTANALAAFLGKRGELGEKVLLRGLAGFKINHYGEIGEHNQALERFEFGWLANRITNLKEMT